VRVSTNGNGGNNVVCSVGARGNVPYYSKRFYRAKSLIARTNAKIDKGTHQVRDYATCGGRNLRCGPVCPGWQCAEGSCCVRQNTHSSQCQRRGQRNCAGGVPSDTTVEWFADLNGNGILDTPTCRRRRTSQLPHRRRNYSPCTENGNEPVVTDIVTPPTKYFSAPAGGINFEFMDGDGNVCDPLTMGASCRQSDAGGRSGDDLTEFLGKFCGTPSALYKMPLDANGAPPKGYGDVYDPPVGPNLANGGNFRNVARADFGAAGNGAWLFCQGGVCANSKTINAVQGSLSSDVTVEPDNGTFKGTFKPMVGGGVNTGANMVDGEAKAVPKMWTEMTDVAGGIWQRDILNRFSSSVSAAAKWARKVVMAEKGRQKGVTCLNGKFVYAREMPDGKMPVVSTVREAYNRHGPLKSGQWACRYMGVVCNTNNCNNNGQGEVPGPFQEPPVPKTTTTTTTMAPMTTTTTTATTASSPQVRRRRRSGLRRRRRSKGTPGASRRRRRRRRRRSA